MQYTLKKSLGQHFLVDDNISKAIADQVAILLPQRLVEIGPGGGALTQLVMNIAPEFKAIEFDTEKVLYLNQAYPQLVGKVINDDFLTTALPFNEPFVLVGNFPYNISTQIVFKILEWKEHVPFMIGMFQKEVAQRVAAKHGNKTYGVLSVLIQAFFEVEYLFDVAEGCFNPPPKVKSGVIRLFPKKEPLQFSSEKNFFLLVKTAFNQRRKTLRNAVKGLFDPSELADPIFEKRAEQLSVQIGRAHV